MDNPILIRHVVSLAGVVREAPAQPGGKVAPGMLDVIRLAGALIEIIVDKAPQAFQTQIAALKSDPQWLKSDRRIDRAVSQADGVFYFRDLPASEAGEGYPLRISMPQRGTRYGVVETGKITVHQNPRGAKVQVARVDVELPITQIIGEVTDQTGQPTKSARVSLRGDSQFVITDAQGNFRLPYLQAGRPLLVVSADGYETFESRVILDAGQTLRMNVPLQNL